MVEQRPLKRKEPEGESDMEFQQPPRFDHAPFMSFTGPFTHQSPSMGASFPPYMSSENGRRTSANTPTWTQPLHNPWMTTPTTSSSEPPTKKQQTLPSSDDTAYGPLNETIASSPHPLRTSEMAPPSMTAAVTTQSFPAFDATALAPLPPATSAAWTSQKPTEDLTVGPYDESHDILQYYTDVNDDNNPVIHLNNEQDFQAAMGPPSWVPPIPSPKRLSDASFSQASSSGFPSLDDLPALDTLPRATSETSWNASPEKTSANAFQTPNASPVHQHVEALKSGSRSRGSPTPRSNARTSPYSSANSDRSKRWTIGPIASSQFGVSQATERFPAFNPHLAATAPMGSWMESPHQHQHGAMPMPHGYFPQSNLLQTFNNHPIYRAPDQQYSVANPRPLPSQGLFRLLSSNIDPYSHGFGHAFEHADPPDLYSSLREEASDPPPEDMNPSDPDLIPREQELRFPGDLYTPRWVRGHGNKREGWCGLCKPGRWLVLKNSAFWYDKSFTHGVSAATGLAFNGPNESRRTEGNSDVWEGLCGSCGDWVSLVSSKKKGTTWFRHAYRCHTHPKVKDAPKRRRETAASMRARTASSGSGTSPPQIKAESEPAQTPNPLRNPDVATYDSLGMI